jgi:CRP-like cAMP-binding protein
MAVDAAALRDIPLFGALAPNDLEMLAQMTSVIEIAAGDILIEEGTPGDAVYAVLEGEL